jgi:hypothetical protein
MAGDVCSGDTQRFDGLSSSKGRGREAAGLWTEPGYDRQDGPLFRATRLCAVQVAGTAKAWTARSGHRRDPGSRQDGAAEAKAYGEARSGFFLEIVAQRRARGNGMASYVEHPFWFDVVINQFINMSTFTRHI